jgi:hypothetical protein
MRPRLAVLVIAAVVGVTAVLRTRRRQPSAPERPQVRRPIRNEGDFRAIFLLIVSLLHGTLFFILGERLIDLLNDYSLEHLSLQVLFFSLFFRILQTHLLAALKYDSAWQIKPYDFVFIFFTALMEYLAFMHESVAPSRDWFLRTVLVIFATFGVVGYSLTYASTRNAIADLNDRRRERIVQGTNITVVALMGALCLVDLLWRPFPAFFVIVNFVVSAALWLNLWISIRLSKVVL